MSEFGKILNAFFEEITWTNYGGPIVTILGRDIGMFILGYLTHLCIEAFIEIWKGKRNENINSNRDNSSRHNSDCQE